MIRSKLNMNFRERKALLEMLNMDEDKLGLSVKKERIKKEPASTSKVFFDQFQFN